MLAEYKKLNTLIKEMLLKLGFTESSSEVYSIMATSCEPLTVQRISKISKYSVSRIYSCLSELREYDLVQKSRHENITVYTANLNFFEIFDRKRQMAFDSYLRPILNYEVRDADEEANYERIHSYATELEEYLEHLDKASEEFRAMKKAREKITS